MRVWLSKRSLLLAQKNLKTGFVTGGDKDSQKKDITKAQQIWQEVKDDIEKL
jgi:putative component of toxin-antitoxin plasmid stabilization module